MNKPPRNRAPEITLTAPQLALIVDQILESRDFTPEEQRQLSRLDARLVARLDLSLAKLKERVPDLADA